MCDWVVDTNVLIVATRCNLNQPPVMMARRGEDVPVQCLADQTLVFEWVKELRGNQEERVVLDRQHKLIQSEYANKLEKHEYGRMVIAEMLSQGRCRFVDVEIDTNGHALIPHQAESEVTDLEDRKMVAAAMAANAAIANACDTDWYDLEESGALERLDVRVHQIIDDWCRREWERKKVARSER